MPNDLPIYIWKYKNYDNFYIWKYKKVPNICSFKYKLLSLHQNPD